MKRAALLGSACAFLIAGAALADMAPSDPRSFDRAAMMLEASKGGFAAAEEEYLAAAASGDEQSVIELARFYMAHELWAEALARLRDAASPGAQLLAAECEYRMGRYRSVAARLAEIAPNDALRAMSMAKLGAYAEARAAFQSANLPVPSRNIAEDFLVMKAETLAASGEADRAAETLALLSGGDPHARAFLSGMIRAARGDRSGALSAYRAADGEQNEWSMRARLALAKAANDVSVVEGLSLQWRGGAFERDIRLTLGKMRLAGYDFDRGFAALQEIVARYPEADAAIEAQDLISATLPKLLADETGLHPKDAARLFFENVEFAPPGREGDALIQKAAEKLAALGLYVQAAQLLDHQVFKRLRGGERATVAADLAELHLLAKKPEGALKVIRSTRIAGLPESVNDRRRLIEAKALAATGKYDNAVALLSETPDAQDMRLRAEINWSRRAWAEAARDYASYVSALTSLDGKTDRTAAVRAATAFLLAGDRAGYRAFAEQATNRLDGAAEADLIRSLGDVDRDQFLAKVMEDYRAVYSGKRS